VVKRAVLLHGTGGSPGGNWFPWLQVELERHGYEVWAPLLPGNENPNRHVYNDFLFNAGWDFTDNLIIGHSSGAVSVLNVLNDERCPPVQTAALVGVWINTATAYLNHDGLTPERFKDLIPEDGFNLAQLAPKAQHWLLVHGDNDPYCPLNQAEQLAQATGGDLIIVPGGAHLNYKAGYTELPQLIEGLESRHWL
jgi:predicted alpha/beta hydrolase family esterase